MSLSSLFQSCLPINRKEVYYTATVLPCIVCADGFAHIHRFWELLGIQGIPQVDVTHDTSCIPSFRFSYIEAKGLRGRLGVDAKAQANLPDV